MDESVSLEISEIRALLDLLNRQIQGVLGAKLLGLYVVGSLVVGDFDLDVSDIDLIAVMADNLGEDEAAGLKAMHAGVVEAHPRWDDRIEVVYVAADNLQQRPPAHPLAKIAPGEPFHVFEARGSDWLINWYVLYENGVALYGAPPRTITQQVALDDLLPSLRRQLPELREWIAEGEHRGGQAYAILTMCRALYTFTRGGFVSKRQAALWTAETFPQWSLLVYQALAWRDASWGERVDGAATQTDTLRFVDFAVDRIFLLNSDSNR